jgi:hypothetical protein
MNDYQPHETYCPSCSAPSPAGGLCACCLAGPEPTIDVNTWIAEILTEDLLVQHVDNSQADSDNTWTTPTDERVCPGCSGLSPAGGYCASCIVTLAAGSEGVSPFGDPPDWDPTHYDLDDHHIFPQAKEFSACFDAAGIDIDAWTMTLPEEFHRRGIHPVWNQEWRVFFESSEWEAAKATGSGEEMRNRIEEQAAQMMEDYGIKEQWMHYYRDPDELQEP